VNTAQQNFRIQLFITIAGVVLFAAKFVAYFLTNSVAVLSDALESIVNVMAGFIGLYSLYVAAKPRDIDHPYGHGKAEFVSAAAEGTLILAAGLLIGFESIKNIVNNESPKSLDAGMIIIGATAVVNFLMGWYSIKVGKQNNSPALIASGKHLQTDTYTTLIIILGLVLMFFFHLPWLDKILGLALSILILITGYKILRRSLAGIMDEADEKLLQKMVAVLNAARKENWIDMHNLRVIQYGSGLHVDCHLTIPWYLNIHQAHDEIDELTKTIKKNFGEEMEMFVHTDGCLDFSCRICSKQNCTERKHAFEQKIEWTLENLFDNQKHQRK
jgi:cation diffusion facilitator family transporter